MSNALDPRSEFYRKAAKVFQVRPTIDTVAYANGDTVGGLQTLSDVVHFAGGGGYIHSITVVDETAAPKDGLFFFFSENPSASTFTDNATISVAAVDTPKICAVIPITTEDYFPVGSGPYVASLRGLGQTFELTGGSTDLYVAYVATEAATYTGANDLIFNYGLAQG